ncbi:MAG TPA: hypothetical protein VF530_15785 [Planctomycetota bacterium]
MAKDPVARQRLVALLTAAGFAVAWHLWVGDAHLNPAEEGYLWYGTWRTGLGEIPVRDFQSYDPGRYYLCAALAKVLGGGLLGLRRAEACVQGLGILFGLLAARRATRASWVLVPLGVVLGAWMFPRHKVFEGMVALACTWSGTRLLEHPTRRRHAAAGVTAGLAAVFGRNLGLYAAVALALLAAVSAWKRRERGCARDGLALAGGVVAGYAPMLALMLLAPGFLAQFVESLRLLLRLGANIEAPWLWPWRVELAGVGARETLARICLALVYLLPVTVLPLGWLVLLRARAEELPRRAALGAAAVVGTLFLHHASVRSDASHLAQSIQPTLVATAGLLALLAERRRALAAGLAVVLGLGAVDAAVEHNPALNHVGRARLVSVQLGNERLRFLPQHADYYPRLLAALQRRVGPEERIFIAPSRPSFYALLGKRSPSWWIYFFVEGADEAEQARLVAELEGVEWVLLVDHAIAEREGLRFPNSYPLVWAHVLASYRRVPTPELEPNHQLYRLRTAPGGER